MKTIYTLCFIALSLAGFSQVQKSEKIKITSAKVTTSVKLAEILDINLKSCNVLSYHFSTHVGKKVKSVDVKEAGLTEAVKAIVKELKAGDQFVIENVLYDCPVVEHKKNFSFVIN